MGDLQIRIAVGRTSVYYRVPNPESDGHEPRLLGGKILVLLQGVSTFISGIPRKQGDDLDMRRLRKHVERLQEPEPIAA